jgi:hypothetical protein
MENIDDINPEEQESPKKRLSGIKLFFLVIGVAVVTSILTVWLGTLYFFPKKFKPVELSRSESQALADKVDRLDPSSQPPKGLTPEKELLFRWTLICLFSVVKR